MTLPNRLRLVDGELVMADGSDVREYLREFARRNCIDGNTPMTLVERSTAQRNHDLASMVDAEQFSLVA